MSVNGNIIILGKSDSVLLIYNIRDHSHIKGAFTYDVSNILAIFGPLPPPLSATVSNVKPPPPADVRIFSTPLYIEIFFVFDTV